MILTKCAYCGKDFMCQNWRLRERAHVFCSRECSGKFVKEHNPNHVFCEICGKRFNVKPYHKKKTKHLCCSRECSSKLKKITYSGAGNHQYGLKGSMNSSWKSDEKISVYGYRLIRCLDHPFKNGDDFVFEHRLVAEKYLLNDENSIEINGKRYLRPELVVHHIDKNKLNNSVDNLVIMTRSEHTSMHTTKRQYH